MAEHDLKCPPESFEAVLSGAKTHELRVGDFRVGDVLLLREWVTEAELFDEEGRPLGDAGRYTGRRVRATVTYVTSSRGGGLAALSIRAERTYKLPGSPPYGRAMTEAEREEAQVKASVESAATIGAGVGSFLRHFLGDPKRAPVPPSPVLPKGKKRER